MSMLTVCVKRMGELKSLYQDSEDLNDKTYIKSLYEINAAYYSWLVYPSDELGRVAVVQRSKKDLEKK